MKAFFDTSVLVPVFYGDHVHHAASLEVFTRYSKRDACCGAHSLVEVYSTLTRMPGKYRVNAEQALLFVSDIRERLALVALNSEEYSSLLDRIAALGITGGAVYDVLLASCALKSEARTLYTWNLRHYERMGPEISRLVRTP